MKYLIVVLSFLLVTVGTENAEAHLVLIQQNYYQEGIVLISTSPPANQQISVLPKFVTLNFSAAVNPAQSSIEVYDPFGNRLETGPVTANGTTISVALSLAVPQADGGAYRVQWRAACQCNTPKPISGMYYFSVL